jgi:hypothetical protein
MVRQALHPTTEMRKPILYSIKIDVTNKDWCPIPAKAAYSLGTPTKAEIYFIIDIFFPTCVKIG